MNGITTLISLYLGAALVASAAGCTEQPTPPAPAVTVDPAPAPEPTAATARTEPPRAAQSPPATAKKEAMPTGHPSIPAGHPPMGRADNRIAKAAPSGAAPRAPFAKKAAKAMDDHELPIALEGLSSRVELDKGLKTLPEGELTPKFERAFRLVFTSDRSKRNPDEAKRLLMEVLRQKPNHAATHRTLGYVHISNGFDVDSALAAYRKAVELDPNYGEAHYALAFTYAVKDRTAGKVHYDKAMALGVPDERNIGAQFYSGAN